MRAFISQTQENNMTPDPKPQTDKDPKYLAWIRKQPCVITGKTPCEAHHTETGGVGMKGSDYSALPLHHAEHRRCHQVGVVRFWHISIQGSIIDHLVRYIKENK